tara:strand:+ start:651 stop:2012 length:1362 start_codon:yes stop_codon:yes gene_type:complete
MLLYYIIIPLIITLFLLILVKKDILLSIFFVYFLHIFLKFFLFQLYPNIAFASGTFINISIVLFFIFYSYFNPQILKTKLFIFFFIYIISFFTYLSIKSLINSYSFFDYIYHVRNYFFNFLLVIIFFSSNNKYKINSKYFLTLVLTIVFFQSIIGLLQYKYPSVAQFFTITEYTRFGQTIKSFGDTFDGQNLVTGTLDQMQDISSFIMLNLIFLISLLSYRLYNFDSRIMLLIIVSIITMLLAGVRAPFIGLIVGLGCILWFKNKNVFTVTCILFLIFVTSIVQTFDNNIQYALSSVGSGNMEDPLTRVLGAFAIFNPEYHELTSVGRTYILSKLIFEFPIFGSSPGIIFSNYSYSDAFLTLWTVETGLIGLTFLLIPYIYTLTFLRKRLVLTYSRITLIIFIVALSQSLTNEGLWTFYTNTQFFLFIMILYKMNNENAFFVNNLYVHNSSIE